jgi:PAS domain S-box-containing protein
MNWVDFTWHLMAGTCIALSAVYLLVWVRRRDELEHLSLALAAGAVSVMAILEPMALQADSVSSFVVLARWFHLPVAVLVIALVPFVRLRYGVGSLWLGFAAIAVRLAALLANFVSDVNLNFSEVTALLPTRLLGVPVVAPQGVANPWMFLGPLSLVLLTCFLVHAVSELSRRKHIEHRLQASSILYSVVFFVTAAGLWGLLVTTSTVSAPFLVVPPFVAVVMALGYDLGAQLLRVPELHRNLAESEVIRRLAELQWRLAGQASRLGAWTWHSREETLDCSDGALALLDLPPGSTIDRSRLADSIPAQQRTALLSAVQAAIQGPGEFHSEFSMPLRDGGTRWLAAIGHLERDADGAPLAVQGVLVDVSLQREADQRFRQVVEAAPIAILIVQADGSIAFASPHAERVFGYSQAELGELSVDELVPSSLRGAHQKLRRDYAKEPASRDMAAAREIFGRRKDGSEVAIEVNLSVLPTEMGQQFLAVINDVSVRKQAEKEAGNRRNELAHLSRVALLAELSGSLAHELNQPLTAILSNAQAGLRFLARDPPDLAEVHESLRNIVESDKRAGEVIRRLRAMLRKDPPDFQRLDLNEVVTDVLHIAHGDLISRNIDVRLQLQADLPATTGDRVQLQQVVLNLVMNGCDAMATCPGRPLLLIRTQAVEDNRVGLDICDAGSGIDEADLERIFVPFVTSKSGGLGLGLAVCQTIVQAHGGELWAENNVGKPGATLYLRLSARITQ